MLDPLHDDLVFNLGSILESGRLKHDDPVNGTLEILFLSALRYCHDREDQLTGDDWTRIGRWLNECEAYFKDFDFVLSATVFSTRPEQSGKHVHDMSGFVEKAKAAWASQFETKST